MSGPAPKPTLLRIAEKQAKGTLDRQYGQHEAKPDVAIPEQHDTLKADVEALAEWERIAPLLERLGLITEIDMAAIHCYCLAWARLLRARQHLAAEGEVITTHTGASKPNPWVAIESESMKLVRAFISEFGLSPAQRARVTVDKRETGTDERAELAKRLFG